MGFLPVILMGAYHCMHANDSDNDGDDLCVEVVGPSWNPEGVGLLCRAHFIYQRERESYPSSSRRPSHSF